MEPATMQLEPRFAMIAIGSLPHTDPEPACRLMLETYPEVAAWPQLPKLGFLENMYAQYSEGLPGIRLDVPGKRIWFQVDEELEDGLEHFYRAVIDEDLDYFRMSGEYAAGLGLFLGGSLATGLSGRPYIKGQVTGPISFGLTVTDQDKRASLYNETLEQVIVKGLTLKGKWQCRELKRVLPEAEVILFYDEPYLHSVGSALLSVSREQVVRDITECVRGCGADITGIHCCGNTDWSLVFATGVDVVHFDAFEYLEPFIAYDAEIGGHLERGGVIAWGVVPKDEKALETSPEALVDIMEGAFDVLEGKGLDRQKVARQSMVSVSCGLGPSSVDVAERAIGLTAEVSERMRERYYGRR